jgi:hypothetical protein
VRRQRGRDRRAIVIDAAASGLGFEQFKAHDFIEADKVVLTFDDGLWIGQSASSSRRHVVFRVSAHED